MSDEPQPQPGDQIVRFINQFAEQFGRALIEWAERMRPAFEALAEIASRPGVREAIERAHPEFRAQPCHCLCGKTHPGEYVCDGEGVTTRRFASDLTGPVDVPLCAPCAVAQGLRELSAP